MNFRYKSYIIIGFATLCLTACVTKKYERPAVNSNDLYRDKTGTDTATIANLPWKTLFADGTLQTLIQQGLNENLDLKQAVERIKIAEATLRQSKAAFLPSLSGDLSVTDAKQSRAALNFPPGININTETQTYKAQLSTSWEADIWGKLSSAKRSAYASLLQTDAAKRAVQTQLIANIANTYYNLLALDKQLAITEQTVKIRETDVETMKSLKEGAIVNGAAVVQSEANLYAAQVTIPDLKKSIKETENALSILLGKGPGTIDRTTLDEQQPYNALETGVSSQLLQNRPDVQAAEFAFRAAFENTNTAKTYFYPALTLTANGGLSSLDLKNFFDQSIFYNLIGGITQPIFNKGQNKARLKTAQAQQQQAFYGFQQTLLTSGQEVSNALFAYQTASEKETTRAKQIASLTKAVDYTKELLRYSSATNYTDVLTSEQSLLAAQLNGINDRLQKLQSIVNLYRALGGGWK
ncbi:efflux transporter outer membrane subunit [Pedobacter panaciterrae]|jgi:efflux transporter, outer membrane factor (OMF) lipoprotein, NodT family|uniref:Efflux transporter outer membrane subunit n=1 Tax=Pedobacter panaciterrae TaxID=363849 RepID=A0ABU8NUN1_9SPHI|nr:efflux transporter outer membrane subunit [Pedobacter panaciterrae]NQX52303.1 efflux transporter outer membrane subunit [Pedobacter panaciterrae]